MLRAVIIDDERKSRENLELLLQSFVENVEIVGTADGVLTGISAIDHHNPDVVFLDIEMPNYAGYELVAFFEEVNFDIIFITAYDQYAVKAFEISAVDYLLKPVEIERLKGAVKKLVTKSESEISDKSYKALSENLKTDQLTKIVISQAGVQNILSVNDIIAIEAQESYSCLYTITNKFLVSRNLKHYETIFLNNSSFFRTHKSWIINYSHLNKFSKSKLEIELTGNITAKLSKYRKSAFEEYLIQQ